MGWYLPKPNHGPIANIFYFKQFQKNIKTMQQKILKLLSEIKPFEVGIHSRLLKLYDNWNDFTRTFRKLKLCTKLKSKGLKSQYFMDFSKT